MTRFRIVGVTALAILLLASVAMAQRRGGAVSGGARGAVVGGLVGGSEGAAKGAKAGAVVGATRQVAQNTQDRRAMDAEYQARAQYQTTPQYTSAPRANFAEAAPEVLVVAAATGAATATPAATAPATTTPAAPPAATAAQGQGKEAVIRRDGKPILGITFPADWKQTVGERSVSAVSADGHAWSAIALVEGAEDKPAGIQKVKQGLEKYLQDIQYDEPIEREGGALLVTGTGKAKKAGVDVVFAAGVFDSGGGLAGAAFVVDKGLDDHYKETVRYICQTVKTAADFPK